MLSERRGCPTSSQDCAYRAAGPSGHPSDMETANISMAPLMVWGIAPLWGLQDRQHPTHHALCTRCSICISVRNGVVDMFCRVRACAMHGAWGFACSARRAVVATHASRLGPILAAAREGDLWAAQAHAMIMYARRRRETPPFGHQRLSAMIEITPGANRREERRRDELGGEDKT